MMNGRIGPPTLSDLKVRVTAPRPVPAFLIVSQMVPAAAGIAMVIAIAAMIGAANFFISVRFLSS